MKRVLSILLALTMILSLSVYAFAAGSPDSGHVREPDVYDVPTVVPVRTASSQAARDAAVRNVAMTKDVTVVDNDGQVHVEKMSDSPEEVKTTAADVVEQMKAEGYIIASGFAAWSDDPSITRIIVKIPVEDVPEGYGIYVNGILVKDPEMHDGFYFIEVDLPAIITIARK